jgi:hypothetical protein
MDFRFIAKTFLFMACLGWALLNVAGLFMAGMQDAGPVHLATHVFFAVGLGAAAWFIRPWKQRSRPAIEAPQRDARMDVLENEVTDLQRQLHETQRSLEFTEQLLKQKPQS